MTGYIDTVSWGRCLIPCLISPPLLSTVAALYLDAVMCLGVAPGQYMCEIRRACYNYSWPMNTSRWSKRRLVTPV